MLNNDTMRLATTKLGENRGAPRVWLQGKYLLTADFAPGKMMEISFEKNRVTLTLSAKGGHKVSSKNKGETPVIDINSQQLREAFGNCEELQVNVRKQTIVLTPSRTNAKIAARVRNGKEGSCFSGGGFLSQAAKQAGFTPAFAVERDEKYAEIFSANHPEAKMFNMSIHDVPVNELEQVELLTLGIPCEPFSNKRRNGNKELPAEAHELGDMTFWALRIIDAVNPYTVVCEEVPGFLNSGAGFIFTNAMKRMGYNVESKVMDPTDYGSLTGRRRAVIVCTTAAKFEWPAVEPKTAKLGSVLDENAEGWFDRNTKAWLFNHWDVQTAKGNGFAPTPVTAESAEVGTIGKRYFAIQGDSPVVAHPTLPGTVRLFSINEVKRLHGIPTDYFLGDSKTTAGEIMGQGVVVTTFEKVIRAARA
jgi:DNA (cytosine-5)-methyltransferase 1